MMNRDQKQERIQDIIGKIEDTNFYLVDVLGLDAVQTANLRQVCFSKSVRLEVVKNTFLKRAMDASDIPFDELYVALKGSTALMIAEGANVPAKLIKEFRKANDSDLPVLKGAFIESSEYVGNDQLELLVNLKSRDELIADVIALLQSPTKTVISQLSSGRSKLSGLVKALSERG